MSKLADQSAYLAGQCLVAMPAMDDPRFARVVIYVCAHTAEGAMGIVLNRVLESITFPDLLEQLGIQSTPECERIQVHFGGPVEAGRGFVLHSSDYAQEATMMVDTETALTATVDVLKAIAGGMGPRRRILALGYAGWSPGQLDAEMRNNMWLTVPADEELVFGEDMTRKWDRALRKLGIDITMLSGDAGHA